MVTIDWFHIIKKLYGKHSIFWQKDRYVVRRMSLTTNKVLARKWRLSANILINYTYVDEAEERTYMQLSTGQYMEQDADCYLKT